MINACRDNKVALMIGFQLRFEKGCALAKRLIESGELGEVRSVLADRSFYEKVSWGYRAQMETLGGILQDHGAHSFDICRWWLGDVKRVSAEIRIFKGAVLEELAYATLLHENHAISCHKHSKTTHLPVKEEFVIDGENASLHLLSPRSFIGNSTETFVVTLHELGMSARDITPLGDPNMETEIQQRWPFKLELEEFARAIRDGRSPSPSGEDGRKNIEIINAAYLAAWRGQTVTVPLTESPDLERIFREIAAEQKA